MAKIEASMKSIPLYEVAEHIVGELDHLTASRQRARVKAWDSALAKLIAAIKDGKLKVTGRWEGIGRPEELSHSYFDSVTICNPLSTRFDLAEEFSDKTLLKFTTNKGFALVENTRHFVGMPKLTWGHICAASGAEVLKLWPRPIKPTTKARGMTACKDWLVSLRRAGPQTQTKEKYKAEALNRFGVGPDQFRTVWAEAAKAAPSQGWGKAGRPKKSSGQKSSGQ